MAVKAGGPPPICAARKCLLRGRARYRKPSLAHAPEADEVLLVVKTTAGALVDLELALAELHPYDVPECVALAPERVEAKYLAWLVGGTRRTPRPEA